jgi:4'-phosphopantetheinyl transferase
MSASVARGGVTTVALHWTKKHQAERYMLGAFSDQELGRVRRIRHQADRDRFVLGAFLLRTVVGELIGVVPVDVVVDRTCESCSRPHGRPRLLGTGLSCSVSHSGDFVVIAVTADGEVGVDVEDRSLSRNLWRSVAARSRAQGEAEPRTPDDFLRLWTAKEAVLKLTGDGLARPMSSIELEAGEEDAATANPTEWRRVRAPDQLRDVRVATQMLEGAVLSIAARAGVVVLRVVVWPEAALEGVSP